MGLAPYGEPRFKDKILEHLLDLKDDGSFRMDMDYFNYCQGLTMTSPKFHELFGGPPRRPEVRSSRSSGDGHRGLDAGGDRGDHAPHGPARARDRPGCRNLVMAGGVALNCVANGKILLRDGNRSTTSGSSPPPETPAGALGVAAMFDLAPAAGQPARGTTGVGTDVQSGSLLGPAVRSADEIRELPRQDRGEVPTSRRPRRPRS